MPKFLTSRWLAKSGLFLLSVALGPAQDRSFENLSLEPKGVVPLGSVSRELSGLTSKPGLKSIKQHPVGPGPRVHGQLHRQHPSLGDFRGNLDSRWTAREAPQGPEGGTIYEQLKELKRTLAWGSGSADTYVQLGTIHTRMGQYDVAYRYLQKAIELEPDNASHHIKAGLILLHLRKFLEGLEEFNKALTDPSEENRAKAWRNMGHIYREQVRWDQAVQAFRQALRFQPDSDTYLALGKIYLERNQLEEAIRVLSSAARLEPDRAEIYRFLGIAYARVGKLLKAVEFLRKVTVADPDDQSAYYHLAKALVQLGRMKEAEDKLQEFHAVQRKNHQKNHRAMVLGSAFQTAMDKVGKGEFQEGKSFLRQVLAAEPSYVPAHYVMGFIHLREGKYEQAVSVLESAVTLDPLNAGAYFYLGGAYQRAGRLLLALDATERAIIIYEEEAGYYQQLGKIFSELNEKQKATRAYEQADRLSNIRGGPLNSLPPWMWGK